MGFHHDTVQPQGADGDDLQIWRTATEYTFTDSLHGVILTLISWVWGNTLSP
jgi:hypothetical protein